MSSNDFRDANENEYDNWDAAMDNYEAVQQAAAAAAAAAANTQEDQSSSPSSIQDDSGHESDTNQADETTTVVQITKLGQQHLRGMTARKWVQQSVPNLLDPAKSPFAKRLQVGIAGTNKLKPDISYVKAENRDGSIDMTLRLWKLDTLVAADILQRRHPGDKIAVLNMANPTVPGGGLLNGSMAQEEALCMHTTLYQGLSRQFYPLRIPDVIYSPDVLVCNAFDNTWAGKPLADVDKWYVEVISAAAIARPTLTRDPQTGLAIYANPTDRQTMREGILSILKAAVQREVKRLVLGAWGCGAFSNPVSEVAYMMKELILGSGSDMPLYNWAALGLEEIVIAIYDTDLARGFPVWNGFLQQFRRRDTLPLEIPRIETTEICHVHRWSEAALENPSDGSPSSHSPAKLSGHRSEDQGSDLDSLFNDSEEDAPAEPDDDKLPQQAAMYLHQITAAQQAISAPGAEKKSHLADTVGQAEVPADVDADLQKVDETINPTVEQSKYANKQPESSSLPDYKTSSDQHD